MQQKKKTITELHKVIILKHILDGVIRVQQTQTLAPAHNETSVLHRLDASVVWFVLDVAFEGLVSEPLDGAFGVPAGHRQPLIPDMDRETRHHTCAGLGCCECGEALTRAAPSAASSRLDPGHQSQAPAESHAYPGITDLHTIHPTKTLTLLIHGERLVTNTSHNRL